MDMKNANNVETAPYMRNGEELEMIYRSDVPMSAKVAFVDSVVSIVIGDDYYYPMLKDMMFDFRLIQFFSNVEHGISDDDDDNAINSIESFLSETNAADVLKINIDLDVLFELTDAVNKAIEYKSGIHPSPIADGIASLLSVVEKKFSEFDMESMTGMAKTFAKLQGDITPDKMLEAYAKSDIFKKQHDDVIAAQEKRDVETMAIQDKVMSEYKPKKKTSKKKSAAKAKVVKQNIEVVDGNADVSKDKSESKENLTLV